MDIDALYKKLSPELDALIGPPFELATKHLRDQDGYLPFGFALDAAGRLALHSAMTTADPDELESSLEVLPALHDGLRRIDPRTTRAVAVCEWVTLTLADRTTREAIKVLAAR